MSKKRRPPAPEPQPPQAESMDVTDEWATAIGWCVIHFGNIEHFTQMALEYLASRPVADSVKHLFLSDRLRVLDGLFQQLGLTDRESKLWSTICKRIEKLKVDYRNPLAHGAPLSYLWQDEDGRILSGVHHTTHRNMDKTRTLEEIQQAAKAMEAASREFDQIVEEILNRLHREGRAPAVRRT